jgi:GNAT superfamily N-acetyltransferase
MPSYQVRPAQAGDAAKIAAVHATSSHAAYENAVSGAPPGPPDDQRRRFWREAIEYGEPLIHVALDGDALVGFVGYDRSRDPGTRSSTGEIWALYVLPGHWGQGAGRALWEAAREGLTEEGCTEVTLWLPLVNSRALRFVGKAGFAREEASLRTAPVGGVPLQEVRLRRKLD